MKQYKALVPLYRGKVQAGELLPEDYNVDVSWVEQKLVALVRTETKKPVEKPVKKYDKEVTE